MWLADAAEGDENTFIMQRENPMDSWGMLVQEDGSVRGVKDNSPACVAGVPVQARITHTNGTATPTGSALVQVLKSLPVTPNMVARITAIVPEGAMTVESAKKTYSLSRPSTSTSWVSVGAAIAVAAIAQAPARSESVRRFPDHKFRSSTTARLQTPWNRSSSPKTTSLISPLFVR